MPPSDPPSASELNRAYYSDLSPGKDDYWRKMAAPRFRVSTLLSELAQLIAERSGESPQKEVKEHWPGSLIDLGCGNGQLLSELAAGFPSLKLFGADLAEPQLEKNRLAMPACEFFVMDLSCAGVVPDALLGRFDFITASEVIEHVEYPERLLENALKLCRPRGYLLLSTQSGPVRETERRVGHLGHFTSQQMQSRLTAAGWTPVRVWNSGFPFHDLSKWYANRDPDASMRQFAGQRYGFKQELLCFLLRLAFRFNSQRRGAQLFAIARRDS
jgi:2-polyprenyl-3-methyl-5-hydroxy-6-metoxy-1,4-benzoquinol methylase